MQQVTAEAVKRMLAEGRPLQLLDCREPWEVELCSLPGAVHIPLLDVPERADELERDIPILVYCHHGVRSVSAAIGLEKLGFEAMSMRGGIDAWSLRIDRSVPRY